MRLSLMIMLPCNLLAGVDGAGLSQQQWESVNAILSMWGAGHSFLQVSPELKFRSWSTRCLHQECHPWHDTNRHLQW